jgi:hypothetical protein
MSRADLDLIRRRLDVCWVDDAGELVEHTAAAPDADERELARYRLDLVLHRTTLKNRIHATVGLNHRSGRECARIVWRAAGARRLRGRGARAGLPLVCQRTACRGTERAEDPRSERLHRAATGLPKGHARAYRHVWREFSSHAEKSRTSP